MGDKKGKKHKAKEHRQEEAKHVKDEKKKHDHQQAAQPTAMDKLRGGK